MNKDNSAQPRIIAVDFDGTLAEYHGWKGVDSLGAPIPKMIEAIKKEMAYGTQFFVYTARVNPKDDSYESGLSATRSYLLIAQWCIQNLGILLPITHEKLPSFTEYWDDRARQVIMNTGLFADDLLGAVPR